MTQTHTLREKGQALFLAALMVLSVFAMSAAFAGTAAAQSEEGFTVTVTDGEGNAISGATVTIDGTNEQTDQNGDAVFSDVANDQPTDVTVSADGYVDETVSASIDDLESGSLAVGLTEDNSTEENVTEDNSTEENVTDDGDAADSSLDSSSYSEETGDVVDFTIEMENADDAVLTIEDENGDYWADVYVESGDEDEVNVSFNTYNAGQDAEAFSTDNENTSISTVDERTITDDTRLNPGTYTLDLYVNEDGDSIDVQTVEDGDRADVEGLELAYTAQLELSEGSIGDSTAGVAPGDADLDGETSVDDLENATTQGDEVAEGDYFVVGVDASGVFGLLDEGDFGEELTFQMEQTNPDTYDAPDELDHTDVEVVEDPENNRVFFILDTEETVEAGAEYDVTFTATEDFAYVDEDTESTSNFSVVERSVEVTGDFDDDDRLQVELDENSTITGESSLAPGSDVQVRLGLGAPDYPTLSQTAEVQDDGTIEADFDVSDREVGEELDVEIEDRNSDASDSVTGVLVESADDGDQEPHPVTITVEDADGNAVSGADVTADGETQTTDDNGEATFELAHGEYDVSASYDGQEATGTLTVGDDTEDSTTIVLGEEDQDLNENAGSDDDEQNQDDNNQDDQNNDDDNQDGSDGDTNGDDSSGDDPEDEEQPGFGIAVALIALLAAAGIALRNRA